MNQDAYNKLADGLIKKAITLSKKKSADYATDDKLSNFYRISGAVRELDIDLKTPTTYALFMVLLKLDRINNLLKKGGPAQNEPIDDSFMDALNYLLLGYAGYKETKQTATVVADGKIYEWEFPYTKNDGQSMTIIGDDGDSEILCKHGVGHSRGVHTCDSKKCCDKAIKQLHKSEKQEKRINAKKKL